MSPRGPKIEEIESTVQRVVKDALRDMLQDAGMVRVLADTIKDAVTSAVVVELQKNLDFNKDLISDFKSALEQKDRRIEELEYKLDDLEQYQRRQCLRIFGVGENNGEDTDVLAISVAEKVGVDLSLADIDRSHRVGRRDENRPRPIIVKFASYRKRSEVFRNKRKLKNSGWTIREDLTKTRHNILREAITKFGQTNVWTQDGVIIVKSGDTKRRITRMAEIHN